MCLSLALTQALSTQARERVCVVLIFELLFALKPQTLEKELTSLRYKNVKKNKNKKTDRDYCLKGHT